MSAGYIKPQNGSSDFSGLDASLRSMACAKKCTTDPRCSASEVNSNGACYNYGGLDDNFFQNSQSSSKAISFASNKEIKCKMPNCNKIKRKAKKSLFQRRTCLHSCRFIKLNLRSLPFTPFKMDSATMPTCFLRLHFHTISSRTKSPFQDILSNHKPWLSVVVYKIQMTRSKL